MKRVPHKVFPLLIVAVCCALGPARAEDELSDKVTAYLSPGAGKHDAVVEVWMENVNPVIGVTLPLKFATGGDSLALDSLVLTGGRAEEFTTIAPLFKSSNQTLLVNMLWKLDTASVTQPIPPGKGPFIWIYLSTPEEFPVKTIKMASVQVPPENVLMYVTETLNPVNPEFEFMLGGPPKKAAAEKTKAEEIKGEKKTP